MNKFLKTVIVGAASGAAAAYFLTTEKGKEIKVRTKKAFAAYKENPSDYHQKAKEKASEYSKVAVDTFNDYKEKFESGELSLDDFLAAVKEKASQVTSKVSDTVDDIVDDVNNVKNDDTVTVEDIIIDIKDDDDKDTNDKDNATATE